MKKLYVGNLSYDTTNESLKEAFSKFGAVEEATVLQDKISGRSRGFGFVTMTNDEEASAAVEGMNNQELDGRRLVVNEARPKTDRDDRPPQRRGFGGGGFNRGPRRDY